MAGLMVTFLFLAVATQGFSILLYGADMAKEAVFIDPDFPDWDDPLDGKDCNGPFDATACIGVWIGYAVTFGVLWLLAALRVALIVVYFLFKAITFDIPGAPWEIRAPIAAIFVTGIGWPLAQFFFRSQGD